MKLKVVKKSEKELEMEIVGEGQTLLNPLKEKLIQDDEVEYAQVVADLPTISKSSLFLKTKKETSLDALKKATADLRKETKSFRTAMNKALKEKHA
ncbi:MAG TPA: DNA-directed RNA polymerase subunit L [Thermoplasmata archaeon]|nr:DNA-directed RNA polymerase subunit L [Thermoplasmata archaeon]HIH97741.1 DNA-directed RNA polymerase subunit L [Thermoplasmata archaeon]